MKIIGYVALAVIGVQIYYIILHYDNIVKYVDTYHNYRYGIDIVPYYIDPSTSDYNDTIVVDVTTKRRCVQSPSSTNYIIVSKNGYAVNSSNSIITYDSLINCIIDMTENYTSMLLSNPCLANNTSPSCLAMLNLLI